MSWTYLKKRSAFVGDNMFGSASNMVITTLAGFYNLGNEISNPSAITDLTNLFENPYNTLTHAIIYPFNIYTKNTAPESPTGIVLAGWTYINDKTPIINGHILNTLPLKDFGYFKIKRTFNDYRDFNGYTKYSLYLPRYGMVEIDNNDLFSTSYGKQTDSDGFVHIGGTLSNEVYLHIKLQVDYYSGYGCYLLFVSNSDTIEETDFYIKDDARLIGKYSCKIGMDSPIGYDSNDGIVRNAALSAIKGSIVAAGHAVTASLVPDSFIESKSTKSYNIQGRDVAKGSRLKTIKSGTITSVNESFRDSKSNLISKTLNTVSSSSVAALSGNSGAFVGNNVEPSFSTQDSWYPILVIKKPKSVDINLEEYAHTVGRPLQEMKNLSELHGFTEITSLHLEGFTTANSEELDLLEKTLTSGIIL